MTNTCHITFNTKDNRETHRYEVWCWTDSIKRFICWVSDIENTDHITGIIKAMGGVDIEFVDTETEPIGGGE